MRINQPLITSIYLNKYKLLSSKGKGPKKTWGERAKYTIIFRIHKF